MDKDVSMKIPHLRDATMGDFYTRASHRLILLDYDETLCAMRKRPESVSPLPSVLEFLKVSSQDPKNCVYILSGCPTKLLDTWFGFLPNLGIM